MNKQEERQRKKEIKDRENEAAKKRKIERSNERNKIIKKTLL